MAFRFGRAFCLVSSSPKSEATRRAHIVFSPLKRAAAPRSTMRAVDASPSSWAGARRGGGRHLTTARLRASVYLPPAAQSFHEALIKRPACMPRADVARALTVVVAGILRYDVISAIISPFLAISQLFCFFPPVVLRAP